MIHAFTGLRAAGAILVMVVILGSGGCAPPHGEDALRSPRWPYAGIAAGERLPPDLRGHSVFTGRWMEATPFGDRVLTETSIPRFLVTLPFLNTHERTFLDLGTGAEVENLGFLDGGRSVILVGSISSPHHGRAAYARALLEIDLEQEQLIDTIPLERSGTSRGFDVSSRDRRAYVLEDDGAGSGSVQVFDLFGGIKVGEVSTGPVPARVQRKGLALDRDGRTLFCLAGGQASRSDFEPVNPQGPTGPQIVVLSADSLRIEARIPLDPRDEPRAMLYEEGLDRICVLSTRRRTSRVTMVDATFRSVRNWVDLPEETSDLVLSAGYAFAPGAHGIYIVDLNLESWISRPSLPFEFTGEIAVSGDQSVAFVLFQSARTGGPPGIASVHLQTGGLLEVVN